MLTSEQFRLSLEILRDIVVGSGLRSRSNSTTDTSNNSTKCKRFVQHDEEGDGTDEEEYLETE